jgi:hypothetical protein
MYDTHGKMLQAEKYDTDVLILMCDYTYTCVPLTNAGSGVHARFKKGMVKK